MMTADGILNLVFAAFLVLLLGLIFFNVLGGPRKRRRHRAKRQGRGRTTPGITGFAMGNGWLWVSGDGSGREGCDVGVGGCASDGGGTDGGGGGGGD